MTTLAVLMRLNWTLPSLVTMTCKGDRKRRAVPS